MAWIPISYERDVQEEIRDAPPADFLLHIQSFSQLSVTGFDKYESRVFPAGGYQWRFVLHPDGDGIKNNHDHISVYLVLADADSLPMDLKFNAFICFSLYNHLSNKYHCFRGKLHQFKHSGSYGISRFISKGSFTNPINGFLVNDSCFFGAEVSTLHFESLSLLEDKSTHTFSWRISDFSTIGHLWGSGILVTGEQKWELYLYPNGFGSGIENKYVSVFLQCLNVGDADEVKAIFSITISHPDHNTSCSMKRSHWFSYGFAECGWSEFVSNSEKHSYSNEHNSIADFLLDDSCLLKLEISLVSFLP